MIAPCEFGTILPKKQDQEIIFSKSNCCVIERKSSDWALPNLMEEWSARYVTFKSSILRLVSCVLRFVNNTRGINEKRIILEKERLRSDIRSVLASKFPDEKSIHVILMKEEFIPK
ncbi:hypothetical protein NPIL_410161 [Nephila pilipes]|uniref:Uncharacterized protein n=1 Tax=Nephila pilipes TaxID=299642 RepID=A0A8X6NE33_NEPPI|nr:hypothetical protein NPIL_410161 [Nephila pilipes]